MSRTTRRIRDLFNVFGLDLRRVKNVPEITLMGLRNRNIKTIIDVGANRGQFAKWMLSEFPNAEFYCFEPLPTLFEELKAQIGSYSNVTLRQVAVGDTVGYAEILEHLDHSPSSSLLESTDEARDRFKQTVRQKQVKVPVTTLDKEFPNGVKSDGGVLLKLDVQGYEDRVLRGSTSLLRDITVAIIEVSIVPLYHGQALFSEICNLMQSSGLTYTGNLNQVYDDDGSVVFLDAVFCQQSAGSRGQ